MSVASQNYANSVFPVVSIAPQVIAAASTVNGTSLDLQAATTEHGADVFVEVAIGTVNAGTCTIQLQDSADNSTFAVVANTENGVTKNAQLVAAAAGTFRISEGQARLRRYVRASVTTSTTNQTVAATVGLYALRQTPPYLLVSGTNFLAFGN
jgi:hypothetical protein